MIFPWQFPSSCPNLLLRYFLWRRFPFVPRQLWFVRRGALFLSSLHFLMRKSMPNECLVFIKIPLKSFEIIRVVRHLIVCPQFRIHVESFQKKPNDLLYLSMIQWIDGILVSPKVMPSGSSPFCSLFFWYSLIWFEMIKSKMPVNINFLRAFDKEGERICRDDWIRTSGPHVPNVMRYRAALHPEKDQ